LSVLESCKETHSEKERKDTERERERERERPKIVVIPHSMLNGLVILQSSSSAVVDWICGKKLSIAHY